jgi:hypothetical protein
MSTIDKIGKNSENEISNNCCSFLFSSKPVPEQPYNLPESLLKDQMISKPTTKKKKSCFKEIEGDETIEPIISKEIPQIEILIEHRKVPIEILQEKTKEEEILNMNGSSTKLESAPTILLNDLVLSPPFLTNPLTNIFGEEIQIERKLSVNFETSTFGLEVMSTEYSNSHQSQDIEEENDKTDSNEEIDHPDILKYFGSSF